MHGACMREGPPIFFTLHFIAGKQLLYLSSRQDINNLVGKFEAIHVRNVHANFQASSFTGMAGK